MISDAPLNTEKRDLFFVDTLTHLLSYQTLDGMLPEALSHLVNAFHASGGALSYISLFTKNVQQGKIQDAAQQEIVRLQTVFRERARVRNWVMQFPNLAPASRHILPDGAGTLFVLPLISRERLLGFVSLVFQTDHRFDSLEQLALAKMACAICAVAENLERAAITRQRLSQLGLFYQLGQMINATFDTSGLLQDTVQLVIVLIEAQYAALLLLDQDKQELVPEISFKGTPLSDRISLDQGLTGWVARHGKPVLVNDVSSDTRFDPRVDGCREQPTKSLICAPLQIKGQATGVLLVANKTTYPEFSQEDLSILITLATQTAIALDNTRLYNSLRAEHERIIQIQENVRHQLARDLHDGPAQLLSALSMGLNHLEQLLRLEPDQVWTELEELKTLTSRAMQETRLVLFELRPIILETQGLVPALESYVERLERSCKFTPHLDAHRFVRDLDVHVAGAIFSIIQEAVNNIEKHAHAKNVWIHLEEQQNTLVVTVEDDGTGFDVQSIQAEYDQLGSFGLLNMRERAELLGGVLTMQSGPRRGKPGTLIRLCIVLPETKE
ncbi:MAG: GAF domain-containing protein [Anaerolineae bacterium]|nr:GAF domain-containing protein [Anaerolineae bacterium]